MKADLAFRLLISAAGPLGTLLLSAPRWVAILVAAVFSAATTAEAYLKDPNKAVKLP